MNRAPNKHDVWWDSHQRFCGGEFKKTKEPPKKEKKAKSPKKPEPKKNLITNFFQKTEIKRDRDESTPEEDRPTKKAKIERTVISPEIKQEGSRDKPVAVDSDEDDEVVILDTPHFAVNSREIVVEPDEEIVELKVCKNLVACPVCGVEVPLLTMSSHLDICLQ